MALGCTVKGMMHRIIVKFTRLSEAGKDYRPRAVLLPEPEAHGVGWKSGARDAEAGIKGGEEGVEFVLGGIKSETTDLVNRTVTINSLTIIPAHSNATKLFTRLFGYLFYIRGKLLMAALIIKNALLYDRSLIYCFLALAVILYFNSGNTGGGIRTDVMLSSAASFLVTISFRPNNRVSTGFRHFPFELNTTIKLPTAEDVGIMPPDNAAKFSHWQDENGAVLFANTHYTVTEDMSLIPVWAINNIRDMRNYLFNVKAGREPIPLVCSSGGDLSWSALLNLIFQAKKMVALDISATALGLMADNAFDVTGGDNDCVYDRGEQYIDSLVLPSAAVTIASPLSFVFPMLRHVSGEGISALDKETFKNSRLLSTIDFPALREVNSSVFSGCPIEKMTLGLKKVGDYDFAGLVFLRKMVLPEAGETGSNVFAYCVQLEEAILPKVKVIGPDAFVSCPMLSKVYAPLAEEIDINAFEGCLLRDITFGLKEIEIERFIGFVTIEQVSFPLALQIGEYAFYSCGMLEKINLPSVTSIGSQAFGLCKSLKTVSLPADNGIIADGAFDSLDLTQVELGDHWSCGGGNGKMASLINEKVYSGKGGMFVYTGAKWARV
jgi:hypothetical protein